jgi:hypothetical protein
VEVQVLSPSFPFPIYTTNLAGPCSPSHVGLAQVTDPLEKTLHSKDDISKGTFAFTTTIAGDYIVCFHNKGLSSIQVHDPKSPPLYPSTSFLPSPPLPFPFLSNSMPPTLQGFWHRIHSSHPGSPFHHTGTAPRQVHDEARGRGQGLHLPHEERAPHAPGDKHPQGEGPADYYL